MISQLKSNSVVWVRKRERPLPILLLDPQPFASFGLPVWKIKVKDSQFTAVVKDLGLVAVVIVKEKRKKTAT